MRARVAVVGTGTVGIGWAVVFARAGCEVALHDPDRRRLASAPREVRAKLEELAAYGLLDGDPGDAAATVHAFEEVEAAVAACSYVQECAPEDAAIKQTLFEELDGLTPREAVLASSSSAIPCSRFAASLAGRGRCLVAHPANPPYLLPIVELVPAPFTAARTVHRATEMLESTGMSVVWLRQEIEGFVFNRLQGALLREAYCLVRDGIVDVDDLDRVVRDGLGRRWSVLGPFETADLNTRGGISAHAERLGPAYARMGAERGQHDPWTPELVARVAAARRQILPLERWDEGVARRDRMLMRQEAARRLSDEHEGGQ